MQQIIISGGPGTGKTSLIDALAKLGFACKPEIARQVIQEQMLVKSDKLPWLNMAAYSDLVFERILAQFKSVKPSELTFYDRSAFDVLAYLRFGGCEWPESMLRAIKQIHYYPKVFIAPFWEEIYQTDNERKEDLSKAKAIEKHLVETYEAFNFEVCMLPKVSVSARLDFLNQQIPELQLPN